MNNSQIRELRAWKCGITDDGAKLLVESLQLNSTMQKIDLTQNKITKIAVRSIFNAALNGVCQLQEINVDNSNDPEVKRLMETLSWRKKTIGMYEFIAEPYDIIYIAV